MRHTDYDTNAYLAHIKLQPTKKTFYTQKYEPYSETNPLTRAPSDFNYFYQQYVEYWANQKKEDPQGTPPPQQNLDQVSDQAWEQLTQITSPMSQKKQEQAETAV